VHRRTRSLDVAKADGYGGEIWLPEDPGQAGKDQGQSYVWMLYHHDKTERRERR